MNLTEISQYRTSALCSTETPPPIGRLPIIDPTDAASAAENPAWHQYIAAVYPGSTAVRDLNTFTFFYWFAPLRVTAFCVAAWKDRKPELEDGTPSAPPPTPPPPPPPLPASAPPPPVVASRQPRSTRRRLRFRRRSRPSPLPPSLRDAEPSPTEPAAAAARRRRAGAALAASHCSTSPAPSATSASAAAVTATARRRRRPHQRPRRNRPRARSRPGRRSAPSPSPSAHYVAARGRCDTATHASTSPPHRTRRQRPPASGDERRGEARDTAPAGSDARVAGLARRGRRAVRRRRVHGGTGRRRDGDSVPGRRRAVGRAAGGGEYTTSVKDNEVPWWHRDAARAVVGGHSGYALD